MMLQAFMFSVVHGGSVVVRGHRFVACIFARTTCCGDHRLGISYSATCCQTIPKKLTETGIISVNNLLYCWCLRWSTPGSLVSLFGAPLGAPRHGVVSNKRRTMFSFPTFCFPDGLGFGINSPNINWGPLLVCISPPPEFPLNSFFLTSQREEVRSYSLESEC